MGTINILTSIAFIGIFVMAITLFAFNFGIDNNTNVKLGDDDDYSTLKSEITENFTTFYYDSNTILNETMKSTISSQTEATEGGTAFKVGPGTAMKIAKSSIDISFKKLFGEGEEFQVFFTSFITLIAIISALFIYKSWKGSPD